MTKSSLLRRFLVGLAVFATMVAFGVILAAGGDRGVRPTPAGHVTAANTADDARGPRHAADAVSPRPNPRARKPRGAGGRSKPL